MRTWFITGGSRGFGFQLADAVLQRGEQVVATARDPAGLRARLPAATDRLLTARLDVTDATSIELAVEAALERFGRIDVLVNNAGYGQLGAFEEISPDDVRRQLDTNVLGVFDVTRAVLPAMRSQRSGHIVTISSLAGVIGIDGSSVYCASKFAVAGWSEALSRELAPFGIRATVVHPGMFRTDFLDASSVGHGDVEIDDYRGFREGRRAYLDASNHAQLGDPARFAPALLTALDADEPPVRFAMGGDALDAFGRRARELSESAERWRALSSSTDAALV